MKPAMTRRTFLRSHLTAALVASSFPQIVAPSVLGRGGATSPNGKVGVAAIGVGPQGQGVMSGVLAQEKARVVAVCDLMDVHREQACQRVNAKYGNKDCALSRDFREVLARADVDAVLVATPDHWHVPVALAAANAGKDIYLEKPMGLSVAEDLELEAAVKARGRIFQFGTQQRSSREFQRAVELVRNGRIGKLKHIDVWAPASRPGGSTAPCDPPPGLDYERWLGPAPKTPYTDGKAADHPATGAWKTWWYHYDYALGFIAGWGVHPLDIALWGHPGMMRGGAMTLEGSGVVPGEGAGNTAVAWDLRFAFADGVTLRYRGTPNFYEAKTPLTDFTDWTATYGKVEGHGTAFVGTDGWVEVHRGGMRASPERLAEETLEGAAFRARPSDSHQKDWIESILARRPAVCGIEESVQADVLCHVSDIAVRLGRKLRYDPVRNRFVDDAEADRRLAKREARPI